MKTNSIAKIICIILIASLNITSCAEKINSDISVRDIADAMNNVISNYDKLSSADDDYIYGMLNIDAGMLDEYVLLLQTSGTEVDQFGIFKITDKDNRDTTVKALKDYIKKLQDNQADFNYLPAETVKLEAAEVYSRGSFIVYTIMSKKDATAFKYKFDKMTTK